MPTTTDRSARHDRAVKGCSNKKKPRTPSLADPARGFQRRAFVERWGSCEVKGAYTTTTGRRSRASLEMTRALSRDEAALRPERGAKPGAIRLQRRRAVGGRCDRRHHSHLRAGRTRRKGGSSRQSFAHERIAWAIYRKEHQKFPGEWEAHVGRGEHAAFDDIWRPARQGVVICGGVSAARGGRDGGASGRGGFRHGSPPVRSRPANTHGRSDAKGRSACRLKCLALSAQRNGRRERHNADPRLFPDWFAGRASGRVLDRLLGIWREI